MSKICREKHIRKKAEMLYRKYRAGMMLINAFSPDELSEVNHSLELIRTADIEIISEKLLDIERETEDFCQKYGLMGTLEDLENCMDVKPDNKQPLAFLAKFHLEKLFEHYERRLPEFPKWPPHAMIGIERFGTDKSRKGEFEIFLLEASLFEDVASLWNITLSLQQDILINHSKEKKKQLSSLARATTKALFNFIEGYLNSLALDISLTQSLDKKQEEMLSEWDSGKNKPKFLKLRDKLLQYPKIAIGVQHPPLTESNCPEIKKIVELENRVRHSLIHPNPQIIRRSPSVNRVHVYLNIEVKEVEKLCDLTITLIRKIDKVINSMFGDIDLWLFERGQDGYFPEEIFD